MPNPVKTAESRAILTPEQQKKVEEWLAANAPDMTCWVCHRRNWIPPLHIVRVQTADQLLGGVGYPFVQMTCATCGHAVFFNAIVLGLELSHAQQEAKLNAEGKSNG